MAYTPYSYPKLSDDTYLVTGLFEDTLDLSTLMAELEGQGLSEHDISVVMSDETRNKSYKIEKSDKKGEIAATMGGTTGLAGAIIFGLASVTSTAASGGLNLVMAGPLLSTMAGFGGGAAIGGILGALAGSGMTQYELEYTQRHLESGHILVAVKAATKEKADLLREVFDDHGAKDVEKEEQYTELSAAHFGHSRVF